jgi:hypothetical protein
MPALLLAPALVSTLDSEPFQLKAYHGRERTIRIHPLGSWDADEVMKLFRERLLARLVEHHAISAHLARKLVAWTHPGFSSHIAQAIPFGTRRRSRTWCATSSERRSHSGSSSTSTARRPCSIAPV